MSDPQQARSSGAAELARMLRASRADTLATFAAYEAALPGLEVPMREELNPPLWALGHVGWFQEYWLARFAGRGAGCRADPDAPRPPGVRADGDALYHSGLVAHDRRWRLPLPDAATTRAELALQLDATLALLEGAADDDDSLYCFRLALLHEDMHHEAALYVANNLGVPIADPRWQATLLPDPPPALRFAACAWRLGSEAGPGFAFDNELGAHEVDLAAYAIDAQVLRWSEYLPFVEDGGYRDERCWSEAGRRWRGAAPRYLRRADGGWQQRRHGVWRELDPRQAACHLSGYEAEAWCLWAGRRLPTEAEWEHAACTRPDAMRWGDVWEWTASAFAPYPGFEPHPYRDYSRTSFDGRPVLRGASFMTQPRMRHPRYRNFFLPHRSDVPVGFRTCAR